jgi:DNA replication protein DnaC
MNNIVPISDITKTIMQNAQAEYENGKNNNLSDDEYIDRWGDIKKKLPIEEIAKRCVKKQLVKSGIPKNLWSIKLSEFPAKTNLQKQFKKRLLDYVQTSESDKPLVLLGKPGSGKTYQSIAVAKSIIFKTYKDSKEELSLRFVCNYDYAKSVSLMEYQNSGLGKVSILIIDDFMNKPTEAILHSYFDLINKRYMNKLRTIIVSNYDIFGTEKHLPQIGSEYQKNPNMIAMLDRLKRGLIWDCNWPSLR